MTSPLIGAAQIWDPWLRLRPRSLQRCVPRSPEAGPGSGQRGPGPRAQKGRLGGRRPSGRAAAASVSSPLAAPARGPAGLGSQSPATGPPGTRLGRDGGCAKAAEVPTAAPDNRRSCSPNPVPQLHHLPHLFSQIPRGYTPRTPLFTHPPSRSGNNPCAGGDATGGRSPWKSIRAVHTCLSADHRPPPCDHLPS